MPVGVDFGLLAFEQALVHRGLDIDLPTMSKSSYRMVRKEVIISGSGRCVCRHTSVFAATQLV